MDQMPLTAADVAAVTNNRGYNDGYGAWGAEWFWIIIILFAFWGNNGWGNRNNNEDIDTRFLERDIFNTNQNVSNTAATTQNAILSSSCQTQRDVLENRYNAQLCCCDTQKEILQNRYDNALQTQTLSSQMAQCCLTKIEATIREILCKFKNLIFGELLEN